VTGVTFGSNLLSQCTGFQFKETNKEQAFLLALLLGIEITQGKTRRQHLQTYWGLEFFLLTLLGSDEFVTRYFSKLNQIYITESEHGQRSFAADVH
jgi:hypothetical protein